MGSKIANIAMALGAGIQAAATHSGQAAARANGVSWASQNAQGQFNQMSADIANGLGTDRTIGQYNFNSAQAASANEFTQAMWDRSAAYNQEAWERAAKWNEAMMERQMQFNHAEAELNRNWQQKMAETNYQRAVKDMRLAGINPILAAGGVSTASGGGSAASVGSPSMSPYSMSPMSGQMAQGGLLNGTAASEGNFTGQMEYLGGLLGLMSAAINGMNSAITYAGENGNSIKDAFMDMLKEMNGENFKNPNTKYNQFKRYLENKKKEARYEIDKHFNPNKYPSSDDWSYRK